MIGTRVYVDVPLVTLSRGKLHAMVLSQRCQTAIDNCTSFHWQNTSVNYSETNQHINRITFNNPEVITLVTVLRIQDHTAQGQREI